MKACCVASRQGGRDAIRIDGVVVESLGLQKNLVAVAIAETRHLILDRRAIARTRAGNGPSPHRRATQRSACMILMRGKRRAGDVTGDLAIHDLSCQRGKGLRLRIAPLRLEAIPMDRRAVQSRRRACLKPRHRRSPRVADSPRAPWTARRPCGPPACGDPRYGSRH